ncbi:MAG: pyridoxamine 5'-phosphate oxidase family protein [Saprospiraceae bacterium]|nr:pyridoxamine 5'-phosphate oxidase family protein [Saprospiraceae bacterium]
MLDIVEDWQKIRRHFSNSFGSSLHVAIASISADGEPTNTPIGTLFLDKDQTSGFYFEKFPSKLPRSAIENSRICVLAVYSSKVFWIKSLLSIKFSSYPAIKLYGNLGVQRTATAKELRALRRRMRFLSFTGGYKYLWVDMTQVREVNFSQAEKIELGKMTAGL